MQNFELTLFSEDIANEALRTEQTNMQIVSTKTQWHQQSKQFVSQQKPNDTNKVNNSSVLDANSSS